MAGVCLCSQFFIRGDSESSKNKPRQYKRDLLRGCCSCRTQPLHWPQDLFIFLPSRKHQLGGAPQMVWFRKLYPLLGSAHASFFVSHLIYFSFSSPLSPLAAGFLATACFSLNLSECKVVCSDTESKSTIAGIKLSSRTKSIFWFWLLDNSSFCAVCSWLGVENYRGSIPWCSRTAEPPPESEGCMWVLCLGLFPTFLMLLSLLSYAFCFYGIHWCRVFISPCC